MKLKKILFSGLAFVVLATSVPVVNTPLQVNAESVSTGNTMDVSILNVETDYDGNEHSATVTCEGATITYGLTEGVYDLVESPKFSEVGRYNVYFKIEVDGFEPYTGVTTVVINKAQPSVHINVVNSIEGTPATIEVTSYTNSSYTIEYKELGADDSTYTTVEPTRAGNYVARVTLHENDIYKGLVTTADFSIASRGVLEHLDKPNSIMDVDFIYNNVNQIFIGSDWKWDLDEDGCDLEVGIPVSVNVIYIGEDADKYGQNVFQVTITRQDCNHPYDFVRKDVNKKVATCKESGYTGDTNCIKCNTTLEKGSVTKKDHTWDDGVEDSEGVVTYTCINGCGETYTSESPRCRHLNAVSVNSVSANCAEYGYTGDIICEDCGEVYEGTLINPLGHIYDEGVVVKEPTHKQEGFIQHACTRDGCDYVVLVEMARLYENHEGILIKNKKEATCKEAGYTGDKYCSSCDKVFESGEVIPKKSSHNYVNGVCTMCGTSSSTSVDKPVPNPTDKEPSVEQTNVEKPIVGQPVLPKEDEKKVAETIKEAKKVKAKVTKVTNKKGKKIELKLKKQKGYKYEIQVSTNKKFKKDVKKYTTSKTSYTVKKLKKGKTYYVRVRTYKVINDAKVYGKWGTVKKVKIKK